MKLSSPNEAVRIELWIFSDETAGILIFFPTENEANTHHTIFTEMEFNVSHIGASHAFYIKDLSIVEFDGIAQLPQSGTMTYKNKIINFSFVNMQNQILEIK